MIIATVAMFSAASSFAAIQVEQHPNEMTVSDPAIAFGGSIQNVEYIQNNAEPKVTVDVFDESGYHDTLVISFTGADLPVGVALLNHTGKRLLVGFSDENFTVSKIQTYPEYDNNKLNAKK